MLRPATILAVLLFALTARAEPARIVTAGSAVTEIAAALGLTPQVEHATERDSSNYKFNLKIWQSVLD